MSDIAGVDHEGRFYRHRLDFADRLLERADRVGIGRLVEADMAVADLQEAQPGRLGGLRRADKAERARYPARNGPEHAGAGPGHAFQHPPAANAAAMFIVIAHRQSPWTLAWVHGRYR